MIHKRASADPSRTADHRVSCRHGGQPIRATENANAIVRVDEVRARIERLRIKSTGVDAIRFSLWKDGRYQPLPFDLPEDDLLRLFRRAIDSGVFSEHFVRNLGRMLGTEASAVLPEHSMVALSAALTLRDGRTLPEGARGAVVFVHGEGEAYEVEFFEPFHAVAAVPASGLPRAPVA